MTVTFAFKAFARAAPCLTPLLATSDPSVLNRILVYIGDSLFVEHFPKTYLSPAPAALTFAFPQRILSRWNNAWQNAPVNRGIERLSMRPRDPSVAQRAV